MTSLVLLEANESGIKQPSRSAVAAAAALGEVHVLVAGENLGTASAAAAKLPGVAKVLVADSPALDHLLAEPTAALLLDVDPVGMVRGKSRDHRFLLGHYVNDRPYVASSFLSVALAHHFSEANRTA